MASKTSPVAFFQQVKTETSKVTWPSRRETGISTIMVLVMVTFASIFFFLADFVFGYAMSLIQGASI